MTPTFTCILCLRELPIAEQTEEHIFPYAIGGMLVLPDMCKPCNDRLGAYVDAGLVEHQSLRFPRRNLGLQGRSRREVTPLVGRTIDDPTGRPRRVTAKPTGGYYYHPHHVQTETGLEIHVDPMDAARLPLLVARAERSGRAGNVQGIVEIPNALVELDLTLHDQRWVRGLVKIAYELAYRALGRQYLRDPTAETLRGVLRRELEGWDDIQATGLVRWLAGPYATLHPAPMSQPHPSWLVGGVFPMVSIGTLSYVRILDTVDIVLLVSTSTDWPALTLDGIAEITDVVARTNRRTTFFEVAMEWAATVGMLTEDTFRAGWFRW